MPRVKLFVSYSHRDQKWLDLLIRHLASLENDGLVEVWDDREIRAASEKTWEDQLLPNLNSAGVIIVLLSPTFASSQYCQTVELPRAIARKKTGEALVFFVFAVTYDIERSLTGFQILPSSTLSLQQARNRDAAVADIVHEIRTALEGFRPTPLPAAQRGVQPVPPGPLLQGLPSTASVAEGCQPNQTASLTITVFDGTRQPLGTEIMYRVLDANQNIVLQTSSDSPTLATLVPYHDDFGGLYAVFVLAEGYCSVGLYPVRVRPTAPQVVDLMLLAKNASFDFMQASWENIASRRPSLEHLLQVGAGTMAEAQTRYADLMENRPPVLACLLNIMTVLEQIKLAVGTPITYLRELIWDATMEEDRFSAWADEKLIEQITQATATGDFLAESQSMLFHPSATRVFKHVQFGEANIQIIFHENERKNIDGVDCVRIELDMDYLEDRAAHTLLDIATKRHGTLSDPRQVYVLRWMAGRHAGVPQFDPLYTIS
jgi:hypothetical protein